MTQQGYFHKWLTLGIILLFITTGSSSIIVIASTQNAISKSSTVYSQSSRQILTRKDIPVLSKTIALTIDDKTREILNEIRNKVSTDGSVTEQELIELFEGYGWTPFIGLFSIYTDTGVWIIPGHNILHWLSFYIGPFIVGRCENEIVFLGVGFAQQWTGYQSRRTITDFHGICTLGFNR
jgi:hypothetical protein